MSIHSHQACTFTRVPSASSVAHRAGNRAPSSTTPSNQLLQAKLRVGPQNDPLEREADDTAERVLAGGDAGLLHTVAPAPQRMCTDCQEEEETIQRQVEEEEEEELQLKAEAGGPQVAGAEAATGAVSSNGEPLSLGLRSYFEPRFARSFSNVRVHTDVTAARAAEGIGARAFTLGSNIAFATGQYAPDTAVGRRLVAHELTHVVQQRRGAATAGARTGAAEVEADVAAAAVAAGSAFHVRTSAPLGVPLRKPKQCATEGASAPRSRVTIFGSIVTWYDLKCFETKKWDLTASHLKIIEQVVKDLKQRPLLPGGFVTVVGHADKVPSTDPDNRGLGQNRADEVRNAVRAALKKQGIPGVEVHAYSLGDEAPAVDTEAPEPQNRRVTILVTRPPPRSFFQIEPAQVLGPGSVPPTPIEPGGVERPHAGVCFALPGLCWPETAEETGRRIARPIPEWPAADADALDQIVRWLTRDIPIPDWLVSIVEAFGVEEARKKLRDALQKGGRAALEKALKEIVEAVAGPPAGRTPEGPPLPEDLPPTRIFRLPPIPF